MNTLIEAFSQGYISLVANIGLLSLLAWCIAYFDVNLTRDRSDNTLRQSLKSGILFGLTTALLINLPIEFGPGIIADARGAPLLMAGIVGGPVSAFITAAMAGATRLYIGGVGATSGTLYIVTFAVIGVLWKQYNTKNRKLLIDPVAMIVLATVATAVTTPFVLTFPEHIQYIVLMGVWPQLWVANAVGLWLLALLISKENERKLFEKRLTEEMENTKKASEAKAKFLTAMSHEIRTPLNGILGIIQVVLQDKLPKKTNHELLIAKESGFFLLSLLNQVLDFAKIEAGKSVIIKQDFNVDALIDGLNSIFHFQLQSKKLDFQVDISPEARNWFYGDLEHIRQILFNLLGNASKFTRQGHIKLSANHKLIEGQQYLEFIVADTGPGIPEKFLTRIFEEFEQANTADTPGGTGLGLAIAKKLSTDMGGDIKVESMLDVGSKFTLTLPVEDAQNAVEEMEFGDSAPEINRSLSILVAEDNTVNQMVISNLLENSGHQVMLVANGQEAVEEMAKAPERFDLILMDIQMPVMTGTEATQKIRSNPSLPDNFPILALTANAFSEQKKEYLDAGMNDVLIKPVQLTELNRALIRYFSEGTTAQSVQKETMEFNDQEISTLCTALGSKTVHELLQQAKDRSAKIILELKNENPEGKILDELLHELKGMISNFGFHAIVEKLENLRDETARPTDLSQDVSDLEAELESAYTWAFDFLERFHSAHELNPPVQP